MQPVSRPLSVLVLFVASILLAFGVTSCRRGHRLWHRRHASPAEVARTRAAMRGRVAYLRYCALCHRVDAQGYAADHANAIGNADFLSVATDDFIRAAITDGRPGTPMSAWGVVHNGPLTPAVVDDIVVYLRGLARMPVVHLGIEVIPGDAARARPVWVARCKSCHGDHGEGTTTATSLSHPNFQRTASDAMIRYTIEHGRRGTPMAAFAVLGPATVNDLVALVRTFNRAPDLPPNWVGEAPPGLDRMIVNPGGQPPRFTLTDERYVPASAVAAALATHRRMVILDARATSDWSREHIPGALPFPFYDIEAMASGLPRDGTWIVAYCACPHAASGHVVDELRRRGFDHTAVLDEGIHYWTTQGYPTAGTGGPLPVGVPPKLPIPVPTLTVRTPPPP